MQTNYEKNPTILAVLLRRSTDQGPEQGSPGSGKKRVAEGEVGGWRLLLTVIIWIVLSVAIGMASWAGLDALAPGWAGLDGRGLVVVAEVYLALVAALLLAFGGSPACESPAIS